MGDVVNFPQRSANPEDTRAILESRLAHGRRIRDRLEAPWVLQKGEPEEVAKALHSLLERIARPDGKRSPKGIRKADILRAAGFTTGDPTKHLSQYTLPPDGSEHDVRITRLRKKAQPYAKIARAAAELSGADADDVLGEVFASVRLDSRPDGVETPPEYHQLAATLRHAMEGIARRCGLASYFKQVEARGLTACVEPNWESEGKDVRRLRAADLDVSFNQPGFYDWDIRFGRPNAQKGAEFEGFIPCYPAVTLGSWAVGEPVPMKVATVEHFDPPIIADVAAQFVAELRLCIAPIEPDSQPKPALRIAVRAMIEPIPVPPQPDPADAGLCWIECGDRL